MPLASSLPVVKSNTVKTLFKVNLPSVQFIDKVLLHIPTVSECWLFFTQNSLRNAGCSLLTFCAIHAFIKLCYFTLSSQWLPSKVRSPKLLDVSSFSYSMPLFLLYFSYTSTLKELARIIMLIMKSSVDHVQNFSAL